VLTVQPGGAGADRLPYMEVDQARTVPVLYVSLYMQARSSQI
jgi:hypothetical protein